MAKVTEALLAKVGNKILSCLPSHDQGWWLSAAELGDRYLSKDIPANNSSRSNKVHHCLLALEKMGYVERRKSKPIGWRRTQAGTEYLDRINGWVR